MGKFDKVLLQVLRGTSDKNVPFTDLCWLLERLGFYERIRGSHHIFTRDDIEEIINIQSKGNHAKPYQVKQVRQLILKYRLEEEAR
jgi:predicted RNA binding protein YcfA (HicA-like mRNA interferase family)